MTNWKGLGTTFVGARLKNANCACNAKSADCIDWPEVRVGTSWRFLEWLENANTIKAPTVIYFIFSFVSINITFTLLMHSNWRFGVERLRYLLTKFPETPVGALTFFSIQKISRSVDFQLGKKISVIWEVLIVLVSIDTVGALVRK